MYSFIIKKASSSYFQKIPRNPRMSQSSASAAFHYFAFGSNLSSKRIRISNKSATFKAIGLLKGYKLEFAFKSRRWNGAVANIVKDSTGNTYGVVWELSEEDHKSLDNQEGVKEGIYERITIVVDLLNGTTLSCLSYQLTKECKEKFLNEISGLNDKMPSKSYKNVILQGANENNLPSEYIEFLNSIQDNGYDGQIHFNVPD